MRTQALNTAANLKRIVFIRRTDEVTENCTKFRNGKFHNLLSFLDTIQAIKPGQNFGEK
jgi:hypothetical protein